jgi:hypothetical protein
MHRRPLLRALPLVALGGCLGGTGGGDDDGGDPPSVTDRSLTDDGECPDPEAATVETTDGEVRVEGCVTGPNGCAVAALDLATIEDADLTVVVTTERDAPPDVACTEALVYRAYTATTTLDGEPASVRVVHDTPNGRRTVVEA